MVGVERELAIAPPYAKWKFSDLAGSVKLLSSSTACYSNSLWTGDPNQIATSVQKHSWFLDRAHETPSELPRCLAQLRETTRHIWSLYLCPKPYGEEELGSSGHWTAMGKRSGWTGAPGSWRQVVENLSQGDKRVRWGVLPICPQYMLLCPIKLHLRNKSSEITLLKFSKEWLQSIKPQAGTLHSLEPLAWVMKSGWRKEDICE